MPSKPKTIITYLIDGNPQGIKTVELSNRIGKAISIPRAKLKEAKSRPECSQPALYFLFGRDEEENTISYIGEAENLVNRLSNHATNKDFREVVIAFVSKDNNITKADVKFLEATAIEQAKKINRYALQNSATPIPNNLPEYQESAMREFMENIDLLIASMGYPILKEIEQAKIDQEKLYYLTARGSDAKGVYMEDGFVLLKGSKGSMQETNSFKGKAKKTRDEVLKGGIAKEEGESFILQEDYICSSPSHASVLMLGRSDNGWTSWKDKDGKTLDENERKELE